MAKRNLSICVLAKAKPAP